MSLTPPISVHTSPFQELWGGSGPWLPSRTTVVRNFTQCGACPPALLRPGNLAQQPGSLPALLNQRESPTPTPESLSSPVPGLRFSIREARESHRRIFTRYQMPELHLPPSPPHHPSPNSVQNLVGGGVVRGNGEEMILLFIYYFF